MKPSYHLINKTVSRETIPKLIESQIQRVFESPDEREALRGKIIAFSEEFIKWGNKINITSKKDIRTSFFHHLFDSLTIIPHLTNSGNILDIGSGNGFPAIPISMIKGELKVFALESNTKKIVFINNIKNRINIKNLNPINQRFELKPNAFFEYFNLFSVKALKITPAFVQNLLFYSKNTSLFFIFNSLILKDLISKNPALGKVINTVDKIVYNNFVGEKKEITKISIKKC